MPENVRFATKPAIAAGRVRRAIAAGVPFAWVAADSVYHYSCVLRLWASLAMA